MKNKEQKRLVIEIDASKMLEYAYEFISYYEDGEEV